MSDLVSQQQAAVALAGDTTAPQRDHHHHPHGDPHLAHHFDSPEQQFNSAKIGMWVFLATELLMFGGLFCAYSVYRHNHPEVFLYAHHYLDKTWGAINTVVLLASSLTMAWGVRAAQLGQRSTLVFCLVLTLLGAVGFMVIKTIEYKAKWDHHVWVGAGNQYSKLWQGPRPAGHGNEHSAAPAAPASPVAAAAAGAAAGAHGGPPVEEGPQSGGHGRSDTAALTQTQREHAADHRADAATTLPARHAGPAFVDPNAGTGDEAKIKPTTVVPVGLAPQQAAPVAHAIDYQDLPPLEKERVSTFFNIYFLMTGLHGIHVLIGMGLIYWILLRSNSPHLRSSILAVAPLMLALYLLWVGSMTQGHLTIPGWRTFDSGMWWLAGLVTLLGIGMLVRGVAQTRVAPRRPGDFGPRYYTPVDTVGLYWHLVDLIWIFLFPLLYLIH